MKKIPLTQGQWAIVDEIDFVELNKNKWYARWDKNTKSFSAYRNMKSGGKWTPISMHRVIMGSYSKGRCVDHINHDTLDNRRCNLRICSNTQNGQNSQKRSTNCFNRYKGVSVVSGDVNKTNQFRARINVKGKNIWLGYFNSEKDAAVAYNEAAKKYFGGFALLNKIE